MTKITNTEIENTYDPSSPLVDCNMCKKLRDVPNQPIQGFCSRYNTTIKDTITSCCSDWRYIA